MVEQETVNFKVLGSNPSRGAFFVLCYNCPMEENQLLPEKDFVSSLKKTNKFSPRQIKLIFFGFLAISFLTAFIIGGVFLAKSKNNSSQSYDLGSSQRIDINQFENDGKRLSSGQCKGTEKRKLTTLPMRYEDFAFILPYGLMVGGHVTPIDHQYFTPTVFNSPRDAYEVKAMADSVITDIQPRTKPEGTEYRMVFTISCKLFYYYDLVTSLSSDIKKIYDDKNNSRYNRSINIPVKAGQLIGRIGGQTLDFAVWDMDVNLKGFIVPEHYEGESWKIHTADPLDYYAEDLKKLALLKYIRTIPPVSGKIDYDIDGKAVGNWFKEGTGGYNGGGKGQDYYKNHLSLTYNFLDPEGIIFSIGQYPGSVPWTLGHERGSNLPLQFGVKDNSPDPKNISVATGLVKYELVRQSMIEEATGNFWDNKNFVRGLKIKNNDQVEGAALIQLISNRKLKVEVFPGKTAAQITGFTDKAIIYER